MFGTKMPIKSPVDCDGTLTALQLVFLLQFHILLTTAFQIDFQIPLVHKKFGKVLRVPAALFSMCLGVS